ncbi:SDR family oxidoreductase [Massilia sp. S19_KUP03_FR1]|uniref:SDR family oxidoreductase n=1 Tax=Massilia sp. S19_KUP03_FR1 TaxID=3025503 RepID=UPI002FCDE20E
MSERKVALVNDGMSALGSAVCRRLHREGFQVTASYPPHQSTPEAWLAAQRDDGFSFSGICADPGAEADCAALVEKMLVARDRLDVLVNLAMLPDLGGASLRDLTPRRWQAVRAMLGGAFHLTHQVLPVMQARQWGRIIQIAAGPAWPLPGAIQAPDHAAANAALQGFTRALALEVARQGVTVNTIVPGCLACNVDASEASSLAHIPVGRLGAPEEVAALVAYLASDLAGFVTGAQLAINGGQHMM